MSIQELSQHSITQKYFNLEEKIGLKTNPDKTYKDLKEVLEDSSKPFLGLDGHQLFPSFWADDFLNLVKNRKKP